MTLLYDNNSELGSRSSNSTRLSQWLICFSFICVFCPQCGPYLELMKIDIYIYQKKKGKKNGGVLSTTDTKWPTEARAEGVGVWWN